jgi:hypothetical protein
MVVACKLSPPPLPGPKRSRFATPRRVVAGVVLLVIAGAGWLWANDPEHARGSFLPCVWFAATGTHCPGCGITRALHDLLHGRLLAALDHNALGLLVLAVTAGVLVKPCWIALRADRWNPPALPRPTARWLLMGGIAWAVLRNLPWAPFTMLAP